jgi:hypothetical protein
MMSSIWVVEWSSSVMSESMVSISCDWSWGMVSQNWSSDRGSYSYGWCLSVDNSVESIDVVSGVCDNSERTVGFNK